MIFRGKNLGVADAAWRIAMISVAWFDCRAPEGQKARFQTSFGLK